MSEELAPIDNPPEPRKDQTYDLAVSLLDKLDEILAGSGQEFRIPRV